MFNGVFRAIRDLKAHMAHSLALAGVGERNPTPSFSHERLKAALRGSDYRTGRWAKRGQHRQLKRDRTHARRLVRKWVAGKWVAGEFKSIPITP